MSYPWIIPVAKYGYLGVQLFFMISGFVIFMSAADATVRSFIASRAARLYPAFWACCSITFVMIMLIDDKRFPVDFMTYLQNMTMFSEFLGAPSVDGAYWSIFVEIRFYILVTIILALRQMHNAEYFIAAWLVYAAKVAFFGGHGNLSTYLVSGYASFFIAGASLYMVWKHGFSTLRTLTIAGAFFVANYQALKQAEMLTGVFKLEVNPVIVIMIISSFFLVMTLSAIRKTGVIGRLDWSSAGALTYPLYLIHQVAGFMLFNLLYDKVNIHVLFWGVIASMLLVAFLVNKLIEKPLSPVLRSMLQPRKTRSIPAVH